MASTQNNPGFTTGQIPTAVQWNSYFTSKQDALISTVTVTGNATVLSTACKYVCDTTAGDITLTISPTIGQSGKENRVRVVKRSATPNANKVIIPNGSYTQILIVSENDAGGAGWLDVDANGAFPLMACGVP
jgi:hypothetical protein